MLLESEKLTFRHARALLGLSEDAILQRRFAQKIVKHNWSVRETERRIKHAFQDTAQKAPRTLQVGRSRTFAPLRQSSVDTSAPR